jgi:hypothetical protein
MTVSSASRSNGVVAQYTRKSQLNQAKTCNVGAILSGTIKK